MASVVVADDSTIRSTRRPRNPLFLKLSNLNPNTETDPNYKKKGPSFRGLGCTASQQVSVPAAIRSSANWEAKKVKKKRLKAKKSGNDNNTSLPVNSSGSGSSGNSNPALSLACVGIMPEVFCGPGIGLSTDAALVDCVVVSTRPNSSSRGKVDGGVEKNVVLGQRERSYTVRRMVTAEDIPFVESDTALGLSRLRSDGYGSRYHRRVRHGFHGGLAEIALLQSGLRIGGRSDGLDRYRDLRLDVDNMSYEELLELGDRIGYVNTGLRDDEIACCLRITKLATWNNLSSHSASETERKCSICQEDYELDDETGMLNCGHFYHIDCIKQWLGQKNLCPICKNEAVSQT